MNRSKNKRKRSALRLEFYAPLSPQQCLERLLRESARFTPGWQRMTKLQNPVLFRVKRLVIRRTAWWQFWQVAQQEAIVFNGEFTPHGEGTLVKGQIPPLPTHYPFNLSFNLLFAVLVLVALEASLPVLLGVAALNIPWVWLKWHWERQRQAFPQELIDWIYDQLVQETDEDVVEEAVEYGEVEVAGTRYRSRADSQ